MSSRQKPNAAKDRFSYAAPVQPFSFRVPKPGTVDPYFGATATAWKELIYPCAANGHKPPVESFTSAYLHQPRRRGSRRTEKRKARASRFIVYSSALAWFEKQRRATPLAAAV
jgi:hypothetical protein